MSLLYRYYLDKLVCVKRISVKGIFGWSESIKFQQILSNNHLANLISLNKFIQLKMGLHSCSSSLWTNDSYLTFNEMSDKNNREKKFSTENKTFLARFIRSFFPQIELKANFFILPKSILFLIWITSWDIKKWRRKHLKGFEGKKVGLSPIMTWKRVQFGWFFPHLSLTKIEFHESKKEEIIQQDFFTALIGLRPTKCYLLKRSSLDWILLKA